MLLVKLGRFEEWCPLILREGGQLLDGLAFLDNIVTKWSFSILINLVVLDFNEPGPVDVTIVLLNLISVNDSILT